ncbi:MAG: NUDIX hydrolase [Acidimicrobiales bacterium]
MTERRYGWHMAEVAVLDAATVMLVRDRAAQMEVLLLKRNLKSTWVGGVHLFPGGAVDTSDGSAEIAEVCRGLGDEEASAVIGVFEGGGAFFVAAVRECFEEAGILLASSASGPLSFADAAVAARFGAHRRRLNAGETSLAEICREEEIALELGQLCYFSRWITPEGSPRRYDTRFFVATAPPDQEALCDAEEVVDATWVAPSAALARHDAGEIDLFLPTIKNLEAIGRFTSTSALLHAAAGQSVPTVRPRLDVEGPAVRILLPGDPGYDEASGRAPSR